MPKIKYLVVLLISSLPYPAFGWLWVNITEAGEDATWLVVGAVFLLGYWTWVASQILSTLRRECAGTHKS